MGQRLIEECDSYVASLLRDEPTGHDIEHARRVRRTALKISDREGGDPELISLIALLHDCDDPKVFPENRGELIHAVAFLEGRVDGGRADMVLEAIASIGFKGSGNTRPSSLEGRIVQDADRLDAMGYIGIARAFAYGGRAGRPLYDSEPPREDMTEEEYRSSGSTINHFYEKLLKLKYLMNTEAGRRMAERRESILRDFLRGFLSEWTEGETETAVDMRTPHSSSILLSEGESFELKSDNPVLLVHLEGQQTSVKTSKQKDSISIGKDPGCPRVLEIERGCDTTLFQPLDFALILAVNLVS